MKSKIKAPEFKKVSLNKLSSVYNKGKSSKSAKMAFYSVIALVFSVSVLFASFFAFNTQVSSTPTVQGLSNVSVENYIPINAQKIESTETNDIKGTYSYRTNLSNNQIAMFYESLSKLNNWTKSSANSYTCSSGNFSYNVTQESQESNIVTFSICE